MGGVVETIVVVETIACAPVVAIFAIPVLLAVTVFGVYFHTIYTANSKQSRKKTKRVEDESSTTNESPQQSTPEQEKSSSGSYQSPGDGKDDPEKQNNKKHSGCNQRKTPVYQHIMSRLLRFIRLGGMLQRIHGHLHYITVRVEDVITYGASRFQDRSSDEHGYHAAHIVRIGNIHTVVNSNDRQELETFGGHTQTIEMWANIWRGIGGHIDRLQEDFFKELLKIDFSCSEPSQRDLEKLQELKGLFITTLESLLKSQKLNDEQKSQIELALDAIKDLKLRDLFEQGRKGYNSTHTEYLKREEDEKDADDLAKEFKKM